mmetsp:Transcript_46475/g.110573  ORF Transcript_46475/g.110573 Transcript_46475/m.110573 type:complete len:302 (-) Transcript_46475:1946-2851(-)
MPMLGAESARARASTSACSSSRELVRGITRAGCTTVRAAVMGEELREDEGGTRGESGENVGEAPRVGELRVGEVRRPSEEGAAGRGEEMPMLGAKTGAAIASPSPILPVPAMAGEKVRGVGTTRHALAAAAGNAMQSSPPGWRTAMREECFEGQSRSVSSDFRTASWTRAASVMAMFAPACAREKCASAAPGCGASCSASETAKKVFPVNASRESAGPLIFTDGPPIPMKVLWQIAAERRLSAVSAASLLSKRTFPRICNRPESTSTPLPPFWLTRLPRMSRRPAGPHATMPAPALFMIDE